ncbi:MAG: hypothetical protein JNK12_23305 [Acidimicrobiales bacterium]|nr:hypothetical protein [Acidimicrobiales bacterium]
MEAGSQRARVIRVVVAALVIAAAFAPAGVQAQESAPAEARSITVTPSSDLDDGQTVTVDGTGWRPGAGVVAFQCVTGTQQCGGSFGRREVNGAGTFTLPLAVRAVFTAFDGTPVDCRVEACEVLAGNEENEDHTASVPIAFDPSTVLLPPPAMTATPDSGLVDGQTVSVAGAGFLPGTFMLFAQCRPGQITFDGCVVFPTFAETEGDGTLSAEVQVEAIFFDRDGSVDCRIESCELVIASIAGGVQARAAIAFDPDGPLRPAPTLVVTPDDGLADGQSVQVTGAGFARDTTVVLLECGDLGEVLDDCAVFAGEPPFVTPVDGAFEATVTVHRRFERFSAGAHDCDLDPCVIRAFSLDDGREVDATISFAPEATDGPPPASPVAASPRFTG